MPDDKWVSGIYDFLGRGYFRSGVMQLMKEIYHKYSDQLKYAEHSYYMKDGVIQKQ